MAGTIELNQVLDVLKEAHPQYKLQKVCERYMLLMATCIANEDIRNFFETDPRSLLENFVGMKIPADAIVKLDPYGTRWPIANFHKDKEEIMYVEGPLSITESVFEHSGKLQQKVSERDNPGLIQVDIPFDRNECDSMVIVLPYFTMETDLLTEYKFKGESEAEIILSSC